METGRRIEIWFFIGALVLVYGVLIFGAGIEQLVNPVPRSIALQELHSDIWWGLLLLALGLVYTIKFWPWRSKPKSEG